MAGNTSWATGPVNAAEWSMIIIGTVNTTEIATTMAGKCAIASTITVTTMTGTGTATTIMTGNTTATRTVTQSVMRCI
jgi:hypothetical protein